MLSLHSGLGLGPDLTFGFGCRGLGLGSGLTFGFGCKLQNKEISSQ